MIENFDSMLAASLQLEEPWYDSAASFDSEKQQMDIWVKVRDRAVFACLRCGSQAKRYGYEPYERSLTELTKNDTKPLNGYVENLRDQAGPIEVWNEQAWCLLVTQVTVHSDGFAEFLFRGENRITVK